MSMALNMDPKVYEVHYLGLELGETSLFRARQLVTEASLPRLLY